LTARANWRWRVVAALAGLAVLFGVAPSAPAIADPVLPAPPVTLSVSQRSTMAILTWPAVPGAPGYALDYSTSLAFDSAFRLTATDSVAIPTGLLPATTYYAHVAAWDPASNTVGEWSSAISFTTADKEYPLAPPLVSLESLTSTSVTATWSKVQAGAHYEAAIGKSADTLAAPTRVEDLTTTFDKLARTTTYYVSVRAVDASGSALTAWSTPTSLKTPDALPLRVGSFNIRNATIKDSHPWSQRRTAVARTIAEQKVAVVGLQEATWTHVPGRKVSQYGDVINLLGKSWRSTTYVGNAGPEGTRIIFDSSQVKLLRQGYQKLKGTYRRHNWRYVTWAEFRQLSTGKRFFFVDTHFLEKQNKSEYNSRVSSAKQLVSIIDRYNVDDLPVIIVGDFNSHKFRKPENAPYDIITGAGYIDPLDNVDGWRGGPRGVAEERIDARYFTINEYKRTAMRGNYATGVMLDQIFTTKMRVSEWQTVVDVDSSGKFVGTIPSDHNMIRATVYLP
jgi:endonuclease/exonuclease/phosphatase family metal-dependent hydrolase